MKADLDRLMRENGVDALLISGSTNHNPAMVYMTGMVNLTAADVIKKCGEEAVLFHNPMERDQASMSGLSLVSYNRYPQNQYYKAAGGNPAVLLALRYQQMLNDLGISSGRIALYGQLDAGLTYSVFSALSDLMPEVQFTGDLMEVVIPGAMETKDELEVERIRQMGRVTTGVVRRVAEFLSSQKAQDGSLVFPDGRPVTIGDVKSRINLWLAEGGAENPEGTIFAIGGDAGVPHSVGNPQDQLRLGQTIVFDIFPCEAGGGFYYDFTRTWCLGYAPDEVRQLFEQVRAVYQQIRSELNNDTPCKVYQKRVCQMFEAQGHSTILNTPMTENGFVHGLGHGVGLNIHERPWFRFHGAEDEMLVPGTIFTLEPGLYYPERGMGVRLEDTFYVKPDGSIEVLIDYPLDLVLPVQGE